MNILKYITLIKFTMVLIAGLLYSCSDSITDSSDLTDEARISPLYSGVTIPPNIAPLNFIINEPSKKYQVHLYGEGGEKIIIRSGKNKISIPQKKWANLLADCKGKDLFVDIFIYNDGSWGKFPTIINHVTSEPIDSYIVYRLFDQGFEAWRKMGIYQRCLEDFSESPVMINDMSKGNCMNCHTFNRNNSNMMMFHLREKVAGTIIYKNGNLKKVNTKTDHTITPGMFASWHPGGKYIAFSNNHNPVFFNSVHNKLRETVDTLSDLVLYDTDENMVLKYPGLATKEKFETFPSWSPDGKYLYFCSANALPINKLREIRYDILRIQFNPDTRQFGIIDTVVSATKDGLSASFPRVSPDGNYLLFCLSSYGIFSIWNSTSDMYIKDLETGEICKPEINSKVADSYHTWSFNGRWIVFSSKRLDGFGTLPYFAYFDKDG